MRADQTIVETLALPTLLTRAVQAACELVRARYGTLILSDPGGGLKHVMHVRVDQKAVPGTDRPADGEKPPSALTEFSTAPSTPTSIDESPSLPGPPPTTSFLTVPVCVGGEVFAHLYLTECESGRFSTEDKELVSALAATAGASIANIRLYEEAQRRQVWLEASTEVTQQMLSASGDEPLLMIVRLARRIADADVVSVVMPTGNGRRLVAETRSLEGADNPSDRDSCIKEVRNEEFRFEWRHTLAGLVFGSSRPILLGQVDQSRHYPSGPLQPAVPGTAMVLPLGGSPRTRGALIIGRWHGRQPFTDPDLEMATTFADHATIALELVDARANQQRIELLEDRARIARDLHDHVTQQLFAIGLTVQSIAAVLGDEQAAKLTRVVHDIDETIRQTRTSIFQLRGPLGPELGTVRTRLLAVARAVAPVLGFQPNIDFNGPVDIVLAEPVVEDLVAVLREALTNAARHAEASRVDIAITATATEVSLEVTDNGVGISDGQRRSGLENLRRRATMHGGSFVLDKGAGDRTQPSRGGTRLRWTVPLQ